jgi:hypothetical protein
VIDFGGQNPTSIEDIPMVVGCGMGYHKPGIQLHGESGGGTRVQSEGLMCKSFRAHSAQSTPKM